MNEAQPTGETATAQDNRHDYLPGFGNHVATEAVAGALPIGQNSPQRVPFGLYAEQFSGTAFTAPRSENRRSWLYRLRPSAEHAPFTPYDGAPRLKSAPFDDVPPTPNRCAGTRSSCRKKPLISSTGW